ncbi:CBM35 domain-containing protein [Cohnella lupini]|uniref:Carbohydrate-binding protein with CBM35 doain n=1 Tax=Cohnella lupini TaxID=1294267 RepID=A0A3D9IJJ2_9BACL|nr:carbohydrate-binding protein with CBM35 doain [Cohnella lupini]
MKTRKWQITMITLLFLTVLQTLTIIPRQARAEITPALAPVLPEFSNPVTPVFNPNYSELIGRSDLTYTGMITSGTQGMPVANGRFGGPVWQSNGNTLVMQLNHTDSFMFNDASSVSKDHTNSGGGALGRVHVGLGADTVFNNATAQRLSLYDGKLSINGTGVAINVIANMNSDAIAIQITDNRATPKAITVDLAMLRTANQVWGPHSAVSTLTTHSDNKTVVLEQVIQEPSSTGITVNNHYNRTAVAATVQGRNVSSVTSSTVGSRQALRLNLPAQSGTFTVIIGGDSTLSQSVNVKANAIANAVNSPAYSSIYASGQGWWSNFWDKSYIYLPTKKDFEQRRNYYMYLAAISNRGNFPSKYNGGIWIGEEDRRDWGSFYWNWNQDSLYQPLIAANHMELMDPMFKMRERGYSQYVTAADQMWGSEGIFIGETAGILGWETLPSNIAASVQQYYNFNTNTRSQDFTNMTMERNRFLPVWNWNIFGANNQASYVSHTMMATQETAEYYWQIYHYTKDLDWLRDEAYPFIKGAAELYRTYEGLRKEADGKYHFYNTNLHEHIWAGKDVIDDLAMARGVFAAVVEASTLLGVDANLRPQWVDRRDNLARYPLRTDTGALWAGSTNSSLASQLATTQPAWAQGLQPSYFIRDLHGTESPIFKMLEKYDVLNLETRDQGLDNGDWAIALNTYLHSPGYFNQVQNQLIDRNGSSRFHVDAAKLGRAQDMDEILNTQYGVFSTNGVYPNLLFDQGDYYSAEGYGTFAAAIQEAFSQSLSPTPVGDPVIRVFPAWPTAWDAKYKLLAKDGFEVSSSMKSGDIQYVEIESKLGNTARVRNPWSTNVVLYRNGVQSQTLSGSLLSFNTTAGETIVLVRPGTTPDQYRSSALDGSGTGTGAYEAESAQLSGGAKVNNDHSGYTGSGFVDGYWNSGATATFSVNAATAGSYRVTARYANAQNNPSIVSLYVNGTKIKQSSFPRLANWDTWGTQSEVVTLNAGTNTIAYKYDSGDTGWINLDNIALVPVKFEAESAQLSGGAKVNTDHPGYTGTGFVDGYWTSGATTTFSVNVQSGGSYNVLARYANAQNNASTVSIYVNGIKIKQASFARLANWDTWGNQTDALTLNAGTNTIAYKYDSGDTGWINLDYIQLQ